MDAHFVCTCSKNLFFVRYCSVVHWGLSGTFIFFYISFNISKSKTGIRIPPSFYPNKTLNQQNSSLYIFKKIPFLFSKCNVAISVPKAGKCG